MSHEIRQTARAGFGPGFFLLTALTAPAAWGQMQEVEPPYPMELDTIDLIQVAPNGASSSDGAYVLVRIEQDLSSDSASILLRRYAADHQMMGEDVVLASAFGIFAFAAPQVARNAGGDTVVVWLDTEGNQVAGRLVSPSGQPLGDVFQINEVAAPFLRRPRVGIDGSGRFFVVWSVSDGSQFDVKGRRFGSSAQPLGPEFQVNSFTPDSQSSPDISVLAGGEAMVTWRSANQVGSGAGVFAQRYDAAGDTAGDELQIHTSEIPAFGTPRIAGRAGTGWLVVWDSAEFVDPAAPGDIRAQRVAMDGSLLGGETPISEPNTLAEGQPSVAAMDEGSFVIAWRSCSGPGQTLCGSAVRFFEAGVDLHPPHWHLPDRFQFDQEVTNTGSQVLITWTSIRCDAVTCGSLPEGVYGQRFLLPLLVDGFESGDASRWSVVVPSAEDIRSP